MAQKKDLPIGSTVTFERHRSGWVFHIKTPEGGANVPKTHRTFDEALEQLRDFYDLSGLPLSFG